MEYRHLRLRELLSNHAPNQPPDGFTALFNGRDLSGWQSWYLESYWDKSAPLPQEECIWLQSHGTPLRFRNIFIRPL